MHKTMVKRRVKTVICIYVHICILNKYLLKWNSFSNSSIWCLVYAVLFLFVSDNIESVLVPAIEREEIFIYSKTQFNFWCVEWWYWGEMFSN